MSLRCSSSELEQHVIAALRNGDWATAPGPQGRPPDRSISGTARRSEISQASTRNIGLLQAQISRSWILGPGLVGTCTQRAGPSQKRKESAPPKKRYRRASTGTERREGGLCAYAVNPQAKRKETVQEKNCILRSTETCPLSTVRIRLLPPLPSLSLRSVGGV
jgi:hypothetical protein